MTTDAQKRLEAIASLEDLGAGFALATHDLEIRGAGELLGEEQSGSMETIGFSLYMELLENAVDALKSGREPSLEDLTSQQTEVELRMPSLLPDDFIPDVNTRLSFYKRIASAKTENELEEIKVELSIASACCRIRAYPAGCCPSAPASAETGDQEAGR